MKRFELDPTTPAAEQLTEHIRGLFKGAIYHQDIIHERSGRGLPVPAGSYIRPKEGYYKIRLHAPVQDETPEAEIGCEHPHEEMKVWLLMDIPPAEYAAMTGVNRSDPDEIAETTDSFQMHVKIPGLDPLKFLVSNETMELIEWDMAEPEPSPTQAQDLARFWLEQIGNLNVMAVVEQDEPDELGRQEAA